MTSFRETSRSSTRLSSLRSLRSQYRAWDTEAPIGDRQGVPRGLFLLPPLSKKKILTEEQSLKLRAIELNDWSAYIGQIYNDLANLTDGLQARWEIDRGALLLKQVLALAVMDGRLARNVAEHVKAPRPRKTEPRFLTHEQVHKLAILWSVSGIYLDRCLHGPALGRDARLAGEASGS